ncbi:MAG: DUF2442 domain-containing protein [Gemmatimonadales bacterium]|nr:DUF2442 domain-containing protein [Gemmatimonadales bacterium]
MTSSPIDLSFVRAKEVRFSDETLVVELADGRILTVPIQWYPRLAYATPTERAGWQLIGRGEGISWPDLDEDLSVEGLLVGRRSGEIP